ncbi:diguanylate cyclase [Guyparkeria hydrothermalis]|uniref:diguanylate cyclase n=1 Tax=Guyparkeria halophila TaxID=47960 RepID=A0A6I6D399_9GAMM|nr:MULTISPECIES: GGDEF domain-containing protein [Guyparkeria]MCL7751611.1 diguanylate cyclase [Guyparkeria hydrothermalis]QGT78074.1 diguanylate cyclase [Guyparkeria halophila]TKA90453.1 diguanylate cyclase [Guyparkeria sp. SB14A]
MSRRRSAPRRRLKARIFGSFGAIGLAGFLISLVLALTITRIYADFQRLTDISERVEMGGEVALQMVELQRLSGEFVQSGRSFPADQAGIVFERARGLLEQLGEGASEAVSDRVERMEEYLYGFREAFVEVKRLHDRQSWLIDQGIDSQARRYQDLLGAFEATLPASRAETISGLERLRGAALRIDSLTRNYFDSLDNARIREVNVEVRESRRRLDRLAESSEDPADGAVFREMGSALDDYQEAILDAVQLTRGYLYLVNVVMAGETYEVLYQSDQLSAGLHKEMEQIEAQTAETIRQAVWTVLVGIALTLALMVFLPYRLGRSVVAPIETLTQTFRRLSRGQDAADLDLTEAGYEFHELTRAAHVFREKNEETERLLREYQELNEVLEQRVEERTEALQAANAQLETLSRTDGLTDLANRRAFEEVLEREWAVAVRTKMALSMVMLDVDHFKPFNDRYGHPAGDECLRRIARVLEGPVRRSNDLAARYGGEEFVLILQDSDRDGALTVAEGLQRAVRELAIPNADSSVGVVTVSVGVATRLPDDAGQTPADLVRRADEALYLAKREGRDQVRFMP